MRQFLLAALVGALCFTWGALAVSRKVFPYTLWTQVRGYDDGQAVYRRERARFFDAFSRPADIVMVGDSIIADVDWREVFPDLSIANRGVRGDTTRDMLARIPGILAPHPRKIVLMGGLNDLDNGDTPEVAARHYRELIDRLRPHAEVIAVSTLPCSTKAPRCERLAPRIAELNRLASQTPGVTHVDVTGAMGGDRMNDALTYDGIHLNVAGFRALIGAIQPHLRASPAAPRAPRS